MCGGLETNHISMKPIKFEGYNALYDTNKPVFVSDDNEIIVTCWQLSAEELKQVLDTGKLYMCVQLKNGCIPFHKPSVFKSDFMINPLDN